MLAKLPSTMKPVLRRTLLASLILTTVLVPMGASALDTDIFTVNNNAEAPNVLIVLDNTSNWSRNDQKFPDGNGGVITQGEAEVAAIRTVVNSLGGFVNVGLMEFVTAGPAGDDGGFVRQAIVPMGSEQTGSTVNKTLFTAKLTTIYAGINTPIEKTNSGKSYGNLMYDAFNYFSGRTPFAQSTSVPVLADSNGYVTNYSKFKSPLSAAQTCAYNYIIFIGNPPGSGPSADVGANTTALAGVGGNTSQLPLQQYITKVAPQSTDLGYSSACFTTPPTGSPPSLASQCTGATATYDSCNYSPTDATNVLPVCTAATSRYSVVATTPSSSSTAPATVTTTTNTGTSQCYASSSNWSSLDTGGTPACPTSSSVTSNGVVTNTTYSCSYTVGNTPTASCAGVTTGPTQGLPATSTALSNACFTGVSTGNNKWINSTDYGTLSCPATTTSVSGGTTTTTSYACSYNGVLGGTTGCTGSNKRISVTQTATPSVSTASSLSKYAVTQTVTKSVTTGTVTGSSSTILGNTFACYASQPVGAQTDYTCPAGATCSYSPPTTTGGFCPAGARYQQVGMSNAITALPTNPAVFTTDTAPYNADEWARFMYQNGVSIAGAASPVKVSTYTIDVYGLKPNPQQSSLLSSMATNGGGRYFAATNANAIASALKTIFAEIQASNSTFASAALPISAANRSQNENEVYLGVFRPASQAFPRWFGNLKRYKLGNVNGSIDLVDFRGEPAINYGVGFITPCAQSWWTKDSNNYWANVNGSTVGPRVFFTTATTPGMAWATQGDDTNLAKGGCTDFGMPYSDLPDGPVVEKGGIAQGLRNATARNVLTLSGNSLVPFSASSATVNSSNSTINSNIVNFILGQDVTGEIDRTPSTANRPSIHGAVVHSRPLPVNYGVKGTQGKVDTSFGIKVFYGSNDGAFRSIDAATGVEDWAFIPPESYPYLQRLMDNSPAVQTPFPTPPGQQAAAGTAPDFYFDGSTGLYQNIDSSKVWIYPTMRRGGRMVYALDVTNPGSPAFKWKAGCPNLTNDTDCTTGMAGLGQTWSTPNVAFLPGFSTATPVLIMGGGYDSCDDADSVTTAASFCASPKGARIYVLNGDTGAVVKEFTTTRSVAGDVSLIDINQDGKVDAAYATDTGGSMYRINFSNPVTFEPYAVSAWVIKKIAATTGASRKFLFGPALLAFKNQVYVAAATGDREHPTAFSYPYTTPVLNRGYVYLDDPANVSGGQADLDSLLNRSAENTCTASAVLPTSPEKGWFIDLNAKAKGEQGVTAALISGGLVAFSTNRPVVDGASCTNGLGEARGYLLNLLNGSGAISPTQNCGADRSVIFPEGGLPPSPVAGTVTIDGKTQKVLIGVAKPNGSPPCGICAQPPNPNIGKKRSRIYWRTTTDTR